MILRRRAGASVPFANPFAHPYRPSSDRTIPTMTEAAAERFTTQQAGAAQTPARHGLRVSFRAWSKRPRAGVADPRDFDVALLRLFAGARRSSGVAMAALGGVFATIATAWLTPVAVLVWFALNLAALALTELIARRFSKAPVSTAEARRWRRDLIVAETIHGGVFATLIELVGQSGGPAALACAVVMALLVAAMNATIIPCIPGRSLRRDGAANSDNPQLSPPGWLRRGRIGSDRARLRRAAPLPAASA